MIMNDGENPKHKRKVAQPRGVMDYLLSYVGSRIRSCPHATGMVALSNEMVERSSNLQQSQRLRDCMLGNLHVLQQDHETKNRDADVIFNLCLFCGCYVHDYMVIARVNMASSERSM